VKKILIPLIAVATVLILATGSLSLLLNKTVKKGVETMAPKLTGTAVRIDGVSISPFSGKGEITGLMIGNPQGFHTDAAIRLNTLRIAMVPKSLLSGRLDIKQIVIDGPEITYEKALNGNNINRIMQNIQSTSGGKKSAAQENSGPQLLIEDLLIRNGTIRLSTTLMQGQTLSVPLPEIHLRDIGKKSNGTSVEEVATRVFGAVNREVATAVAGSGRVLKDTAATLGEKAKEGVSGFVKGLGNALQGGGD